MQMAAKWVKQLRPFLPGSEHGSRFVRGEVRWSESLFLYGMLGIKLVRAANCRQAGRSSTSTATKRAEWPVQSTGAAPALHAAEAVLTLASNTNVLFTLRRLKTNLTMSDVRPWHTTPCRLTRIADVFEESERWRRAICYMFQRNRLLPHSGREVP